MAVYNKGTYSRLWAMLDCREAANSCDSRKRFRVKNKWRGVEGEAINTFFFF